MILNMMNTLIGIPTFSGDYAPYWINCFYMAEYTAAFALVIYLIKKVMLIFDWGVKIAKFARAKFRRG